MQLKAALKVVSLGLLVAVAGCSTLSSLNPFASKPTVRHAPAALVDFKPTMAVRSAWTTSIGKAGNYTFTPAVAGDSVYVAGADGALSRVDAASGRSVWRIEAAKKLTAGVGTDGKTVVVAAEKGILLAYDSDGKLRWKAQASSEVLSAPAVGEGVVVVRSLDNRVIALDTESGERRWFVQRTTPALTLRTAPGITIANGTAYVALPGGRLLALMLATGAPRWEVAVGDPRGTTELERIADISGAPIVSGREVCAVAYQGRVACFDTGNGGGRWAKEISSNVGLGVDERFVFAADERSAINAFARDSGTSVWRNSQLANRDVSAPASFGRAVAVGDMQGYVHFLSREDGALLARLPTDGSPISVAPVVAGSNLVLQTQSGTVIAIAIE